MDFSDVDNASSDVGAEVSEVENKDVDFGDGDGVNDFDETYSEMNSGGETLEYAGESEKQTPLILMRIKAMILRKSLLMMNLRSLMICLLLMGKRIWKQVSLTTAQ